ncbi:MAG: carbohydrate kinase [Magnetococcales bacterium]|nr:carbohydrate kinase [Magnetococcales bacterium]
MTEVQQKGGVSPSGRPILFGEVLFDQFEDGIEVLGGAPFNVAWHLAGFGLDPLFISRVGQDSLGDRVLEQMARQGMTTVGMQQDGAHPTGRVEVALAEAQPCFSILPEQAYDFIDWSPLESLLKEEGAGGGSGLFYHGSLIARSPLSRETLIKARGAVAGPVMMDLNLRPPWWDEQQLLGLLRGVDVVKMNAGELDTLTGQMGKSQGERVSRDRLEALTGRLSVDFGAQMITVTMGEHGAFLAQGDVVLQSDENGGGKGADETPLIDTVGAGDAFSAVLILGLYRGWPLPQLLERANGFARAICSVRGATPADPTLYEGFMAQWQT